MTNLNLLGIDLKTDITKVVFTNINLKISHTFTKENSCQIKNAKDFFHNLFTEIQTFIKEKQCQRR